MSGAWERTHRRYDLVHAVLDEIARSGWPIVPTALRAEIDEVFGDFGAFLRDVQRRWYQTFDARLDDLLENPPEDLEGAVRDLWQNLDRDQVAARVLLDGHAAHPALAAIDEHHRRSLLTATGFDQQELRTSAPRSGLRPARWWRRSVALSRSTA